MLILTPIRFSSLAWSERIYEDLGYLDTILFFLNYCLWWCSDQANKKSVFCILATVVRLSCKPEFLQTVTSELVGGIM